MAESLFGSLPIHASLLICGTITEKEVLGQSDDSVARSCLAPIWVDFLYGPIF